VLGDLRYPATVVFGLRRANRELAALDAQQRTRQQSRRHHQVTLGRTAVALADALAGGARDDAEYPALQALRAPLAAVEDERARHASEVAAADAELAAVRGGRELAAKQCAAELTAVDAELADLAAQLVPLERDAVRVRKRARKLHEAVGRIDAKIAAAEAGLARGAETKLDPAQLQAEIATLRAERKAVQSDEPAIAGELDALNPQIAALEAARGEAQRKRSDVVAAEHDDQQRIQEVLIAIGARRKVVDRATAAAEAQRDKLLFQLGERLCVDRPADLTNQLAPIDEIDVELGSADRRIMELRELRSSVDYGKLARGLALLIAILGGLGALAAWLVPQLRGR
jgi:chromosome segregation ATPase